MRNGKIVQSGTHEGLMQKSPEYSSLIKNCAHNNAKKYFVWVLWFVEIMVFYYVYLMQLKWLWLFQSRFIYFFYNFMFIFLNLHFLSPSCYGVTYEQSAWSFWTIFFFQYDDGIHLLFHVDYPKVVPLQLITVSPVSVLLLEASVLGSKPHKCRLHLCMCHVHIVKSHGQVAKETHTYNFCRETCWKIITWKIKKETQWIWGNLLKIAEVVCSGVSCSCTENLSSVASINYFGFSSP